LPDCRGRNVSFESKAVVKRHVASGQLGRCSRGAAHWTGPRPLLDTHVETSVLHVPHPTKAAAASRVAEGSEARALLCLCKHRADRVKTRAYAKDAQDILCPRENPKIGWRVDPDISGVSEVRSFRVFTWTEYSIHILGLRACTCRGGISQNSNDAYCRYGTEFSHGLRDIRQRKRRQGRREKATSEHRVVPCVQARACPGSVHW